MRPLELGEPQLPGGSNVAYLSHTRKTGRTGEGGYKLASEMWIQESIGLLGSVPVCANSTEPLLIMLSM